MKQSVRFLLLLTTSLTLNALVAAQPSDTDETPLSRFEQTDRHMGITFRVVLYAKSESTANEAAQTAFQRIAELDRIMSDYKEDSELNRLARTSGSGEIVPVSDDLWRVLKRSQSLAEQTDGAFDITVGPFVDLWRKARFYKQLPPASVIDDFNDRVGYRNVTLYPDRQAVQLTAPNMRLDLGGIAKGDALEEAMKVLKRHGIKQALVAGGGDIRVSSPPPNESGWRIGIAPLEDPKAAPSKFIRLNNQAMATSGDMFQFVEINGTRYSHIVDPRTGLGLTDHSLVHVIAPNAMTADSLATVVSVLGPDRGFELISQESNTEARVTRKPEGQVMIRKTEGFAEYYEKP